MEGREQAGKEASPSAAIVDSQSVKTPRPIWGIRRNQRLRRGQEDPSGAPGPVALGDRIDRLLTIRRQGLLALLPPGIGSKASWPSMGRKRHLLTETLGLPLAITVHSAGIQDRDGFALVVDKVKRRFPWLLIVFAATGYNAIQTAGAAAQNRRRLEIVKRPRNAEGFHLLPRPLQGLLALSPAKIG